MNGKLTVRQRKILGILNSQKERISGREIAEYLGVTDRTVRTDIQVLTEFLCAHGAEIDAIRGKGYLLVCRDPSVMQTLVYQADALLTPEDRMRAVTMILLESVDPVEIDDLAEECFVSRSTIEHDLKVIAFEYEKEQPHIRLIRHRNTVALEMDEWKRRYVMNLLYVRRWNFNYEAGILMADLPLPEKEMEILEEALAKAQKKEGISLTEYDHVSFLFSLAIAIRRFRTGFIIDTFTAGGTAKSMAVVEQVMSAAESFPGGALPAAEKSALSDELAHRQQYNPERSEEASFEIPRNGFYAEIIDRTLRAADEELSLELSGIARLKNELLYILLTQAHNPYHAGLRDEYVTRRVRAEYPDAIELAARMDEAICGAGGEGLTENYLFELVACLAEAIEEEAERKRAGGIPVAVISHMTIGATKVLMTQLKNFFGSRVKLLGPVPVYEASRSSLPGADLAVTTTKMRPFDQSMPYLTIPRLMDKRNFERMNFLISLENYRKLYPGEGRWITDRLSFFETAACPADGGRWKVLENHLCSLNERGFVPLMYKDEVLRRERQTSTAFREGFAIPHTMNCAAAVSGLVLLKLDGPVDWGGISVEAVLILFLDERAFREKMRIYSGLVYMLRRLMAQKKLTEVTDGEALKALLTVTERMG